jgi:methylmalonyl-CoA/ethylmalonyl-CoA epimerase
MKLGTVLLGVKDLERALGFYRDLLGFPVKFQGGEVAFLDAGGPMIALRHVNDLGAFGDERRTELVMHVDDVQSSYEALRAKGITFDRAPRVVMGDRWATDFRDPDGHVLSIFGPNAAVGGT